MQGSLMIVLPFHQGYIKVVMANDVVVVFLLSIFHFLLAFLHVSA